MYLSRIELAPPAANRQEGRKSRARDNPIGEVHSTVSDGPKGVRLVMFVRVGLQQPKGRSLSAIQGALLHLINDVRWGCMNARALSICRASCVVNFIRNNRKEGRVEKDGELFLSME